MENSSANPFIRRLCEETLLEHGKPKLLRKAKTLTREDFGSDLEYARYLCEKGGFLHHSTKSG